MLNLAEEIIKTPSQARDEAPWITTSFAAILNVSGMGPPLAGAS